LQQRNGLLPKHKLFSLIIAALYEQKKDACLRIRDVVFLSERQTVL
jgi:hypothetical protein